MLVVCFFTVSPASDNPISLQVASHEEITPLKDEHPDPLPTG